MKYKSKEEAQKDHIDNYRSDGYDKGKGRVYSSDYPRAQFVLDHVGTDKLVLDVGCNGGTLSIPMKAQGNYVKGIDIVPELVEKAIKRGLSAQVGEAEKLPFKDNKFDVVVCTEVLEHLYDPLQAIKEAYRVLKPNGIYILSLPHPEGYNKGVGDYHNHVFRIEQIDNLFNGVFGDGNCEICYIPYEYNYSERIGVSPEEPQWYGLTCTKKAKK